MQRYALFLLEVMSEMRGLNINALKAALIISGFSTFALADDLDVTAVAPLERAANSVSLDKAKGVGPRFKFSSAPPELSLACALSIRAHVNEAEFVDYGSERNVEEFRARIASFTHLNPGEAERAPLHQSYAIGGEGQISGASCANLKAGPETRGGCTGTISGSGYTVVYSFDPVACRYDNIAVAKALITRLSVGHLGDRARAPDCATRLEGFITDIDALLATKPRNITDVYAVLNRHFPLRGCAVDEASRIVRTSRYFQSAGKNGPKRHVFWLDSGTKVSQGVEVGFALWDDTGDSDLPFAMWSPRKW